jgi:glucosamine--fructose-6-phosphate aminotransferase (isomerizing)
MIFMSNERDLFKSVSDVRRSAHPYYSYEDIHEQPSVLQRFIDKEENDIATLASNLAKKNYTAIYMAAPGTSRHACLGASYAFERFAGIHTEVFPPFEFVNYPPLIGQKTLFITVSECGWTKVSRESIKKARSAGADVLSIVNAPTSPIAKEADYSVFAQGGDVSCLVTTKGFTTELMALYCLAVHLGRRRRVCTASEAERLLQSLHCIPSAVEDVLKENEEKVRDLAKQYGERLKNRGGFLFGGGGPNYVTALEAALKSKEISSVRSEGFEIEELVHGPFGVWGDAILVVIALPGKSYERALEIIKGAKKIGTNIVGVVSKGDKMASALVDQCITIPSGIEEYFSPIPCIVPLQLLSYYVALEKGVNPDMIRTDDPKYFSAIKILFPPGTH